MTGGSATEKKILAAQQQLSKLMPGVASTIDRAPVDGRNWPSLTLTSSSGRQTYLPVSVGHLTDRSLDVALAQRERTAHLDAMPPLLLPSGGTVDRLVDALVERGVEFLDGAGNMYLSGPACHALVRGRRASPELPRHTFTPAGLRVVYALLTRRELRMATYRELAAATGVGLGTVGRTIASLQAERHVVPTGDDSIRFSDPEGLLQRWELGYVETLRARLKPTSWRAAAKDVRDLFPWNGDPADLRHLRVGGELGAARLTAYLAPQTATLYTPAAQRQRVAKALRLLPDDADPNVWILEPVIPPEAEGTDTKAEPTRVASPALVRAELLSIGGDRLREVAQLLLGPALEAASDDR